MVGFLVRSTRQLEQAEHLMRGLLFSAVNYRLAPQYPFPCGLQDVLAACMSGTVQAFRSSRFCTDIECRIDLYLIDPPPGAYHTPVDPSLIVPAGDSAGGNLVLALLYVVSSSCRRLIDATYVEQSGDTRLRPSCASWSRSREPMV